MNAGQKTKGVLRSFRKIKGKQVKILHGHAAVTAELLSWEGSGMALSGHWEILGRR
jgi:hypothetical protein